MNRSCKNHRLNKAPAHSHHIRLTGPFAAHTEDPRVILNALKGQFVFSFALGELIDGLKGSLKNLEAPRHEKLFVGEQAFTAVLTPDLEDGGYTVSCKEIPAAISQGETIQEALDNLVDAIELCLETEKELSKGKVQAR